MPIFSIPVSWSMFETIEIDADNIEKAIDMAKDADLGTGEYMDGSFEIDVDHIPYCNELGQYPKCEWNNHTVCPSYKKDEMDRMAYTRPEERGKIICSFYDKEEKYCFNQNCKMHNGQNQIASVVDQVFHKTGE